MRFQITAIVEGDFIISENLFTYSGNYKIELEHKLETNYISVSKKAINYSDFMTKYLGDTDGIPSFQLTPYEYYKDMVNYLHYIEAIGSFSLGITKIHWEELTISWIPELPEEEGIMPIRTYSKNFEPYASKKSIRQLDLSMLVSHKQYLEELTIPFTYYRQAKNFFENRLYYFAYINFFMMLEYCFANGQFKKEAIIREFSKSHILKKAIINTLEILPNSETHYLWLKNECKNRGKEIDVAGIIYLLVEHRGLLSHATQKSKQFLFNDNKLFSLAFIISTICFIVCGNLQIGYCLHGKQRDEFLNGALK